MPHSNLHPCTYYALQISKVAHSYELFLAGFEFAVIPEHFIVHIPHDEPKWRTQQNWTRVWLNWYEYLEEVHSKYSFPADFERSYNLVSSLEDAKVPKQLAKLDRTENEAQKISLSISTQSLLFKQAAMYESKIAQIKNELHHVKHGGRPSSFLQHDLNPPISTTSFVPFLILGYLIACFALIGRTRVKRTILAVSSKIQQICMHFLN